MSYRKKENRTHIKSLLTIKNAERPTDFNIILMRDSLTDIFL
ncbi:hypothetical protein LEP1GSC055_1111 [Leptospira borgpetersenii str. Brem 307]|nr:hypothetical protein LEP1GSC055_1111 [Leptospira borgpetersenii str. Brem 307]